MKKVRIEYANEAAIYELLLSLHRMAEQMPDVKDQVRVNIAKLIQSLDYPEMLQKYLDHKYGDK